jgi:riboflavin kinase/FMN adenylyltransferase
MKIHFGFDNLPTNLRSVVTIGSFDGVHRGHRVLLAELRAMAERLECESVVLTFDPHPRIAMGRDEGMGLLTTIEERALLLAQEGIDHLVVAHFDDKFRSQPYEVFVRDSLVGSLGMVGMIVGYNHRLGRGSEGGYASLLPLSEEIGFELRCVMQYKVEGDHVSSTVVRRLIESGDMRTVERMLGVRYIVVGEVLDGVLRVADLHKLLPPVGCYDVLFSCGEKDESATISVTDDRRLVFSNDTLSGGVIVRF